MSNQVDVQKAFGGKYALSHVKNLRRDDQKQGAERAATILEQQLSPAILGSQIHNVSKGPWQKRGDKGEERYGKKKPEIQSNPYALREQILQPAAPPGKEDLNSDIKLSMNANRDRSRLQKRSRNLDFNSSALLDKDSVCTVPLSPLSPAPAAVAEAGSNALRP